MWTFHLKYLSYFLFIRYMRVVKYIHWLCIKMSMPIINYKLLDISIIFSPGKMLYTNGRYSNKWLLISFLVFCLINVILFISVFGSYIQYYTRYFTIIRYNNAYKTLTNVSVACVRHSAVFILCLNTRVCLRIKGWLFFNSYIIAITIIAIAHIATLWWSVWKRMAKLKW